MKKILTLLAFLPAALFAQSSNVNVLSYYASDNSLDGQPVIEEVNVLRFFPVFAISASVDSVRTTIYYGSNIYSRDASKQRNGKYWETLLPVFNLGEAIQRIEVRCKFYLDKYYNDKYNLLKQKYRQSSEDSIVTIKAIKNEFATTIRHINNELKTKFGISSIDGHKLQKNYSKDNYIILRDSILIESKKKSGIKNYNEDSLKAELTEDDFSELDRLIVKRAVSLEDYKSRLNTDFAYEINSLRKIVKEELIEELTDTNYTGPSVRKSDITISEDFTTATILYRNYNYGLRRMPALDPGERMGIFRVRYVPFPITGTPDNPKMTLLVPFQEGSPAVFEIGLAFGDEIVPSDKRVNPVLSWSRLGVAFAITEKLFNDDAQIIALALTYDFNSYGSIGFGANLAQGEAHPYVSFGINKKAFEAVVKGLASLF